MRIVAGRHRGRTLVAPKEHSTRPTADRTRQALFNVLEHAAWTPDIQDARVADLFAGSGALGLEALSRGAASCVFVENDATALAALTQNIATLRLEAQTEVRRADATRPLSLPAPVDIAFLDPPYAQGAVEPALAHLASGAVLAMDAIVVVERGIGEPPLTAPGFTVVDSRAWGAARVWFLKRSDPP